MQSLKYDNNFYLVLSQAAGKCYGERIIAEEFSNVVTKQKVYFYTLITFSREDAVTEKMREGERQRVGYRMHIVSWKSLSR